MLLKRLIFFLISSEIWFKGQLEHFFSYLTKKCTYTSNVKTFLMDLDV